MTRLTYIGFHCISELVMSVNASLGFFIVKKPIIGLMCVLITLLNLLTLVIFIFKYSIFFRESCSICCASSSSFLSRDVPILWIIFSAPCFTLSSMFSCFSRFSIRLRWLGLSLSLWPVKRRRESKKLVYSIISI